jgi:chitodextrinase
LVTNDLFPGPNELAVSAILLTNAAQTAPLGRTGLNISTSARTGESETVTSATSDLVVHIIADRFVYTGILGSGETSRSIANDGKHAGTIDQPDGDASLWISTKPGESGSTTVSSMNWPSGVINGVALVVHGSGIAAQAPTAPGNLAAKAVSGTQINLSWSASTDNVGVTGYLVERQGPGSTSFAQVGTTAGTIYNDTGLVAKSSYSYRARATDAAGNLSPYSAIAIATTLAPNTQPPTAPGNLAATAVSASQINLSWTAATDNVGVTGYLVERQGPGSTGFAQVGTTAGTTYNDTGLVAGNNYSYRVRATDAAGNLSAYSAVASATTLALPPSLVAAYSFNEGTGTSVTDVSGSGNNGTIANATWTTAGKYGNALVFNGTTALVTINDSASLDLTKAMTLEAWVNPSVVSSAWRDVVYKGDDNYYLEGTSPSVGVPCGAGRFGTAHVGAFGRVVLALNTWTHLATSYDGTTLRFYVNGVQVSSRAQTGAIVTSNNPLQIGGDSLYGHYFQGMIDEVRVYDTALTAAQIQADMNTPINATPNTQALAIHLPK